MVKCPATFATVEARTVLIAELPHAPTPEVNVPLVALIVSVIVPEELVNSGNPVAGAPANTRSWEVTAVGAWKQIVFGALQGATAALVVPCVIALNPAVVPLFCTEPFSRMLPEIVCPENTPAEYDPPVPQSRMSPPVVA